MVRPPLRAGNWPPANLANQVLKVEIPEHLYPILSHHLNFKMFIMWFCWQTSDPDDFNKDWNFHLLHKYKLLKTFIQVTLTDYKLLLQGELGLGTSQANLKCWIISSIENNFITWFYDKTRWMNNEYGKLNYEPSLKM